MAASSEAKTKPVHGGRRQKGLVELHDYLERSFLVGWVFSSPPDFNAQLASFLDRANNRRHQMLGYRPAGRIEADRVGYDRLAASAIGDRMAPAAAVP
jgi:hypothetical protein